jgi:hypothetical protein
LSGDKLAIAAVAGLAGAAALRRSGSRSTVLQVDILAREADLPLALLPGAAGVVQVSWPGGSERVTAGRLREVSDDGNTHRSRVQDMQALIEFAEWARALQFPLTVYRGVLMAEDKAYRVGGRGGHAESWSSDERSALRFAREGSPTAPKDARPGRSKGQLVTAVIDRPGDVAWLDTLGFFLTYSAGQLHPEYEIVPVRAEPTVIRVQEVRPRDSQAMVRSEPEARQQQGLAAAPAQPRRAVFEEL